MFKPEPHPYHINLEFKVGRRISWEGELDEFRQHLDAVCEALEADSTVEEYAVRAQLETETINLEIVVSAASDEEADSVGRDAMARAIQEAGGFHEGLLSLKDESMAKSKLNAWAGLRTPRWQHRRAGATKL